MNFTFNSWVVLFTTGCVIGIFMALLFFLSKKKYTVHVQNISMIFLILSLLLFSEIAEESNLVDRYPFLLGIAPIIDLLIWPFLLFFIQYLGGNRTSYHWKDMGYFIPFFISLAWTIPFIGLSEESQLSYYAQGIPGSVVILVTFKLICTLGFQIYILRILSSSANRIKQLFSTSGKIKFLHQTRKFIVGISLLVLTIYLMFYIEYFQLLPIGDSDRIGSLIISAFIYLLGGLVFTNPHFFLREEYTKQIVSFFDGKEYTYIKSLLNLFETKKPYLNEKLSVKHVAKDMALTDQQLSYLINRQLGISFMDFVNTYRINEVKAQISNGVHLKKTLLGLGLEAGFNSKASFNRNFKELTGISPSTYVAQLKEVSNQN